MSTSKPAATGVDRPRSFSRFIRRASKALKPDSSNSLSKAAPRTAAGTSGPVVSPRAARPAPAPSPSAAAKPSVAVAAVATVAGAGAGAGTMPLSGTQQSTGAAVPAVSAGRGGLPMNAKAHVRLQEDKARALFAKYGLTLGAGDWTPLPGQGHVEWVEKKVRMRVHRQCHRCGTSFGADKVCTGCVHVRCKKCPRTPAKGSKQAQDPPSPSAPLVVEVDPTAHDLKVMETYLTSTSVKRGSEVVRKLPVHRVRRFCHKCEALFQGKAVVCGNCRHSRCPQCPREPAKLSKHGVGGYPDDVEETFPPTIRHFKHPRHRVRWTCHTCEATFKSDERTCRTCAHDRCDDCTRSPPRRNREADEEIMRSLKAKMEDMRMVSAAAA